MVRPIAIVLMVWPLLGCSGTMAQSRGNAPIAWDGLGADPNARPVHHERHKAPRRHQNDQDITGSLPPRPDWYPVLSPEEVEQEKRLLRAITICRGCDR